MNQPSLKHLFIISGTTRGIGKALMESALELPGSFVIGLSRSAPSRRDNLQNIEIDLTDTERIGQAIKRIRIDRRRIDGLTQTVLINNAGVLDPIAPIGDCDDKLLSANIQVNLIAPMVLSRHFYRFAKPFPGRKWIVNITSGAGRSPYHGWSAYGAAKAGIDMATRIMALEFSRIDPSFSACAVAPGTVDTAMQSKIRRCSRGQFEQVDKFIELKQSGSLDSPGHVGARIIRLLMAGRFENGGHYDLRTIPD